jgi:hypothetical protein
MGDESHASQAIWCSYYHPVPSKLLFYLISQTECTQPPHLFPHAAPVRRAVQDKNAWMPILHRYPNDSFDLSSLLHATLGYKQICNGTRSVVFLVFLGLLLHAEARMGTHDLWMSALAGAAARKRVQEGAL